MPMTRPALALLFTAALSASAAASPWRFYTGLPIPERERVAGWRQRIIEEPVATDGVEHPYLRWRGLTLGVLADLFAQYRFAARQGQTFNEFELTRVQPTVWAGYKDLAGVHLTLETLRSSGSRSYFGVDGDSIVVRVKWAFGEITPLWQWLAIRAGIIPDLLLQYAEASWSFRAQGPTGIERDGLFTPGDVGASAEVQLPIGLGSVGISYTNGEGLSQREQNEGKNLTVVLRIRPALLRVRNLYLHLLYRDGSIGAGQASDSRLAGAVTYLGRRLGAGAVGTWALGYRGIGFRDAAHLSVWGRGELPARFYLYGRADLLWPDAADVASLQARVLGGVAYALPSLVRILLGYEGTFPVGTLTMQVPAVEEHALLVQLEARL
jgi:hypothetical protein